MIAAAATTAAAPASTRSRARRRGLRSSSSGPQPSRPPGEVEVVLGAVALTGSASRGAERGVAAGLTTSPTGAGATRVHREAAGTRALAQQALARLLRGLEGGAIRVETVAAAATRASRATRATWTDALLDRDRATVAGRLRVRQVDTVGAHAASELQRLVLKGGSLRGGNV